MQKKNKLRISGVVLTYNEEENIGQCLNSIKWVDEIIVVDSYSNDSTVRIAKEYSAKVFFEKFTGDFSSQRNSALKYVTSNWVLVLDADEKLQNNVELQIRKVVSKKNVDGYWFKRKNYINEDTFLKYGIFYPDYQLRLIRYKKDIKYVGVIHEQPNIRKDRTQFIKNIKIFHNNSHSKYDKISSFHKFIPYIRIEGTHLATSKKTNLYLLWKAIISIPKWIKKSVFDKKGYLDGFSGIRAAFIFGLYRFTTYGYAICKRLIRKR